MKLHVHVGVHKTATTYLQGLFTKNKRSLNRAGVGAMALGQFRPFFTRNLMQHRVGEFRIEHHLDKFFEGGAPDDVRGLILSDENLIGLCNDLIATGKAYQRAEPRLERARGLLAGHQVTLFMAIRSYDDFTASAYCEAMRHTQQFATFDSFRARFDLETLRWPKLIRRLQAALKPADVKIWRFEDFRGHEDSVLKAIAFGADAGAKTEEAKVERPSFSGPAVSILEMISTRLGPSAAAQLVGPVSDILPKGTGNGHYPSFAPWEVDDRRAMASLYDEDCAAIPGSMWLIPLGEPLAGQPKAKVSAVA
jgi:hypothetical protein